MNEFWSAAVQWLLHLAVGGGLLLLVTCLLMRWTPQPARRQRLGEWGITAALLVGLLCLAGPSWLVIAWHRGEGEAPAQPEFFRGGPLMVDEIREKVHRSEAAPAPEPAATPAKHDAPAVLAPAVGHANLPPDPADGMPADDAPTAMEKAAVALLVCFAGIAGFFTLRLLLGYAALGRLLLASESAPPEVHGLFAGDLGR